MKNKIGIYSSSSVSAAGLCRGALFTKLLAQKSPEVNPNQIKGFSLAEDGQDLILKIKDEKRQNSVIDRAALLAIASARLLSSSFELDKFRQLSIGLSVGSSRGPTKLLEDAMALFLSEGQLSPLTSPTTTYGNITTVVAQDLGIAGPLAAHSATCTGGLAALQTGCAYIRAEMADLFFCIGTEAPLTPFTLAQMDALGILAKDLTLPYPCRPMEGLDSKIALRTEGTGLMLGEGSAGVIIGVCNHPALNDQKPLAILSGIASAAEPLKSLTGVSNQGDLFYSSMKSALKMAGNPSIDLVMMHAPGTIQGDNAEYRAITRVFKENNCPLLYSPKWLLGHTFGASGLLSLDLAISLLENGKTLQMPYACLSDCTSQANQPKHILINSAGFGGISVSAVVSNH